MLEKWKFALAALAFISSIALAESNESPNATPLFDYANAQPSVAAPFDDALRTQVATLEAEISRHPPPSDAECAHTLGASRFARVYETLGSAQANVGNYPAAVSAFERALACAPRATSIHAELASELLHAGRLAEARAAAARGVAIDGDSAALDSVLMQLDFIEEHWADAVARLRAMVATQTDEERAAYYLCFLWLAQRRAGVKEPDLTGRTTKYADWPAPILATLQSSISEGDLLEVIRDENNEVRRRELLAEALYYIGQGRLANGEADNARRYFAAVVNLRVLYFIEHHLALAEIMKMRD